VHVVIFINMYLTLEQSKENQHYNHL